MTSTNRRRATAAVTLGAAILGLAGCTSTAEPVPIASATSVATTEPLVDPDQNNGTANVVFSTKGITVGETVGKGHERRRELLVGDMSALLEGVELPREVSDVFSSKEIEEAQQGSAAFLVKYVLDSGYLHVTNADDVAVWFDVVKPRTQGYLTEQLPALKGSVGRESQPVPTNIGGWRGLPDPDRPTTNGSYFEELEVTLHKVRAIPYQGEVFVSFDYVIETRRPVVNSDRTDKKKYDEYMRVTAEITPSLVDRSRISGYQQNVTTRTVEEGEQPDFDS